MKRLFFISLVICAASFIMAAITDGIWGHRYGGGTTGTSVFVSTSEGTIFNECVGSDKEWHIVNEFSEIEVDSAAVKTLIVPTSEDEMIRVCAQVPYGKSINVSADWEDNSLRISAHPKTVTFDNIMDYGVVNWLDDIFGDNNGVVVTIEIPEQILETFSLKQGSGTTIIRNINAVYNDFDIGSGTVNFYGSGNYAQNSFNLDLGSGKACVTNMLADHYTIDIGSGRFVVSGLKGGGSGIIDFGSGKGSVFYSQLGDCEVDMGSGSLDMYVPNNSSAVIDAEIGSGYVNIDALGIKQIIGSIDDEPILIGGHSDFTSDIDIDLGSGNINIYDYNEEILNDLIAEYAVEEPTIPSTPSDTATVSAVEFFTTVPEIAESPSLSEAESSVVGIEIAEISDIDNVPTPPEVTEATDAPTPPEVETAA